MSRTSSTAIRRRILFTASAAAVLSLTVGWAAFGREPVAPVVASRQVAPSLSDVTPQQMIDAFHSAFGVHRARAVHAKGIMAEGDFTPSAEALHLSKAPLFTGGRIPALIRFSNFTGIPDIPDNIGDANPRGLAIKFTMSNGGTTDIVAHSFNGFPAADAAEFRQLLLAIGASGPGAAKPTAVEKFLASHPVAKTFLTTQKPAPISYATLSYFGVNSFRFTDDEGVQHYVRYRFIPVTGEALLPSAELSGKSPNYLSAELPGRLARGPVAYDWYAQIAEHGDIIDNPSIAWPEKRTLVKLGTIRIQRMAGPSVTDKQAFFQPTNLPIGIEPADPMLLIRQGAYPISFAHRQ